MTCYTIDAGGLAQWYLDVPGVDELKSNHKLPLILKINILSMFDLSSFDTGSISVDTVDIGCDNWGDEIPGVPCDISLCYQGKYLYYTTPSPLSTPSLEQVCSSLHIQRVFRRYTNLHIKISPHVTVTSPLDRQILSQLVTDFHHSVGMSSSQTNSPPTVDPGLLPV